MAKIPKQFADDFNLWVDHLMQEGDTKETVEEIKQQIRDDWADEEKRKLWIDFVSDKAATQRALISQGRFVTDAVKAISKGRSEGKEIEFRRVFFEGCTLVELWVNGALVKSCNDESEALELL